MADFPTISIGESPSRYEIENEQNDIRSDTDGGYEFRRKRFTRADRVTIKSGFIGIPHTDYTTLVAFWQTHTTVVAFNYFDYINGVTRQMRFEKPPKWDYAGVGPTKLWNVSFEMKEV